MFKNFYYGKESLSKSFWFYFVIMNAIVIVAVLSGAKLLHEPQNFYDKPPAYIGIISLLIPFSLLFTGISITVNKKFIVIIENIFFTILYIIIATFFFGIFHNETYWLIINGNNGFVGELMSETIIADFLKINKTVSYYLLIFNPLHYIMVYITQKLGQTYL